MNIIEIGGSNYQIGTLPAMTQFHVVRRIGPVLAELGISITEEASAGKDLKQDEVLMRMLGTAGRVLAQMTDADVEYVINSCLGACRRQQGERYMPVLTGKSFQFSDIDMQTMLRLTVEVLKENLGNFFPTLPAVSATNSD